MSSKKNLEKNVWNTFVSCLIILPPLGFIFILTYPMSELLSAVTHTPSVAMLICFSFLTLITVVGGLVMFVFRLFAPASWKYTLRYNFFATINFGLGLIGLINGGNGLLFFAMLLGAIQLFDIYLVKQTAVRHRH